MSIDTVLDLLQSKQRRYALYYLDEQETPVPIEELAEEVAKMEEGSTENTPTDDEIHRYEVSLQHAELPKADQASFVDYDSEEGVVRLTNEPPEFKTFLSVAEVIENPRQE